MAYDLLKLARMQDVRDFTEKLKNRTEPLTYNNAAAHNSIYRGKNLGSAITGDMIANIRNGSYKDWYPGDTLTLPIDGTTNARVMGCASASCTQTNFKNHVILLLRNQNWNNLTWNDTDTIEGHLYSSKMFTEHLPYILGKIKEVIPDEYILKVNEGVADSVDSSGNVNHYTTVNDLQIFLPSMQNWFGFSSDYTNSGYKHLSNLRWHWSYAQAGFHGIWLHRTCNSRGSQWCTFAPWAASSKFAVYENPSYTHMHAQTNPYILLG